MKTSGKKHELGHNWKFQLLGYLESLVWEGDSISILYIKFKFLLNWGVHFIQYLGCLVAFIF